MLTTLIEPAELAAHLTDADWAVVDCRFDLADTSWGERAYGAGHIPGALYAHLDRDLSGPHGPRTRAASAARARGARRDCSGGSASMHRCRWWPTTRDRAPSRRGCGGCCAGSGIRRWRC